MPNQILRTLQPYAPNLRPHPASTPADWRRWMEAWRAPDPAYSCPRCGSGMKRRKGKRGVFLGCARYPDCKGTRNAPPILPASKVCPICDVGHIVTRISARGNEYKQCEDCGEFIGGRSTTAEEKLRVKADKAAKAAADKLAAERKSVKAGKLQRKMMIQLEVEGFDYGKEWGELWVID